MPALRNLVEPKLTLAKNCKMAMESCISKANDKRKPDLEGEAHYYKPGPTASLFFH